MPSGTNIALEQSKSLLKEIATFLQTSTLCIHWGDRSGHFLRTQRSLMMKNAVGGILFFLVFAALMSGMIYVSYLIPLWVGICAFVAGLFLMGICEWLSQSYDLPNPGGFFMGIGTFTLCLSGSLRGLFVLIGTGVVAVILFVSFVLIWNACKKHRPHSTPLAC